MKTYLDNIEIDSYHRYHHEKLGIVPSVTTIISNTKEPQRIINPSDKMIRGTAIHNVIELYLKGLKDESKEQFNQLNNEDKNKVTKIFQTLSELKLIPIYSELSFVCEDNNIKFGGTVDLIANYNNSSVLIDFKTGAFDKSKHLMQISSYAYAIQNAKLENINIKKAGVIYFDNNELKTVSYKIEDLINYYQDFIAKARNFHNIKTDFDLQILDLLSDYSIIINSKKELEEKLEDKKQEIETCLSKQNLSKLNIDNYTLYHSKPKELITLSKEAKKSLYESNPTLFTKTVGKPSFAIKIKE